MLTAIVLSVNMVDFFLHFISIFELLFIGVLAVSVLRKRNLALFASMDQFMCYLGKQLTFPAICQQLWFLSQATSALTHETDCFFFFFL